MNNKIKFEEIVLIDNFENIRSIFGDFDENIKIIEEHFNVAITSRDNGIKIVGDDNVKISLTKEAIIAMNKAVNHGDVLNSQAVHYIADMLKSGNGGELGELSGDGDANSGKSPLGDCICVSFTGRPVRPKTVGQKRYTDKISKNTIVFGIGPAGTGKTYLAVAKAVAAFKAKEVQRIILTRPAVEAGESLGFLPGDLQHKVDPYLRPLYDALFDMMGAESFAKNMERGIIEVAPLAYMRGRTLDDSFIILDEAQNTTPEQMKMFLTRLGFNSKMVITGDVTQIDLSDKKRSGLVEAITIVDGIPDTAICHFSHKDVVRHRLVQEIVKAYEKHSDFQKSHNPQNSQNKHYKQKPYKSGKN